MADAPQPGTSLTLLARLRADESDAWAFAVKLYSPLVYRWCGRGGVSGADADDLTQEVFRAAAAALPRFHRDQPGDTFRGWLRGIARNRIRKHHERAARTPRGGGGTDLLQRLEQIPDEEPPDAEESASETAVLLRQAMELVRGEFEDKTWRAFWRTALDGASPADVAPELGVSEAAVRKYKSRVLHRLRAELGELLE